ncbi:putative Tubulin glycylase 3A [Blattamonas nauphoetae]|uniref:Tubulin--tyrosine ligase-like protein 9 n=1 Tax=Blattamonas nauphoetae TaxID=2049346 RepID=A0ABQ9YFJ6_9EUKA|nr:putative Tubulin glycylase 3A [Blattamonas nauphoetae]
MSRNQSRAKSPKEPGERTITFRAFLRNTILDVLLGRGWFEVGEDNDNWDIIWADVNWVHHCNFSYLREHQRVNHFPNHYEFTRKDLLNKTLRKYKRHLERTVGSAEAASRLDFVPLTYVVPQDYGLFREEFKKRPGQLWIAKPLGAAQGRGIFLVSKLSQLADWKVDNRFSDGGRVFDFDADAEREKDKTYLIQSYLSNPLLVGGKKFDLRIYVLVTSFLPLTVWLYRTGFGRFSFSRFSMDQSDVENTYIHLTNVAIQKTSSDYDPTQGCKWDLKQFKLYIISKYGLDRANALFMRIQHIIITVLLAAQQVLIADRHCFELYGFDVLIDDTLKPWLLEVNASPSLTADTASDYHMKYVLLNDMLDVVDIERKRTAVPTIPHVHNAQYSPANTVGGFDLIYQGNGPVAGPFPSTCPSLLGTSFNTNRFPHALPERLKRYDAEKKKHDKKRLDEDDARFQDK